MPITIALVVLAIIVVVVMYVASRPSDFRISRGATIAAPPAAVFAQVNDLRNWDAWSPFSKIDPNSKVAFEGPPAGVGAIYKWDGNKKVGQGSMTVVESRPNDLVRIRLDFLRPFKGTNYADFTFLPSGNRTAVTWSMEGKSNFIMKGVCLFMNMDRTVGGEFEKGLAQMKSVVESVPRQ